MPRSLHLLPCVLVSRISLTTGCQATVGNYLANRGNDLRDIAGVAISLGPGIDLSVRATAALQVQATYFYGIKLGTWHRGAGIWKHSEKAGGVSPLLWMRFVSRDPILGDTEALSEADMGIAVLPIFHLQEWVNPGEWSGMDGSVDQGWWDIGAGVHLGLAGVHAYFNPAELLDFFLGWFGVDITGDDVPLQARESPVEKE